MNILLIFQNYKWVIAFYFIIILIIYLNRKKFQFQGKLIALYRTKIGLKFIDKIAKKYRKFVRLFGYFSIVIGYIGFFAIFILLIKAAIDLVMKKPGAIGASPVIPGVPIAGTGLVFPLIIGWVSLFIIIVVHEFSHGVVIRAFNLRVLHSGIAFFGPILGAFVEPDEKRIIKRPDIEQYSIYSAGPVSNLVLAGVAWLVLSFAIAPALSGMVDKTGVEVDILEGNAAETAGMINGSIITKINSDIVYDSLSLLKILKDTKPNQRINLTTTEKNYTLITTAHPQDPTKGYLGILFKKDIFNVKSRLKILFIMGNWLFKLFLWLAFISLNVGLINLFPIFITDGARMIKVAINRLIKDKKKAFSIWKNINVFAIFILLILLLLPLFRWISGFLV